MDVEGSVAIGEEESAVRQKGEIGWHESIAPPNFGWIVRFVGVVNTGFFRRSLGPKDFAFQIEFGKFLDLLVRGNVEKLLIAFFADFDSVSTTLVLIAKRSNEFALFIKYKNGRMVFF